LYFSLSVLSFELSAFRRDLTCFYSILAVNAAFQTDYFQMEEVLNSVQNQLNFCIS